jgi:hypothetical protein
MVLSDYNGSYLRIVFVIKRYQSVVVIKIGK